MRCCNKNISVLARKLFVKITNDKKLFAIAILRSVSPTDHQVIKNFCSGNLKIFLSAAFARRLKSAISDPSTRYATRVFFGRAPSRNPYFMDKQNENVPSRPLCCSLLIQLYRNVLLPFHSITAAAPMVRVEPLLCMHIYLNEKNMGKNARG